MNEYLLRTDIEEIANSISNVAEMFAGKTILLGGGQGFLGRYFQATLELLNRSHLGTPVKLIVVDNLITTGDAAGKYVDSEHRVFVNASVTEPLSIDEKVDFVVNAAGIASPYYYRAYPLEALDAAISGTRNLLNIALEKDARFCFFSSSEIYGDPDPDHIPTPESYRGNVASMGVRACYDESKRVGETLCYIFHDTHGVHTNAIRPFNIFGPGMQETDYRVLPNFASCLKMRRPLKVYGSGKQTRTFCYVTDALNGFLRVIAKGVPGEAYNIGNPLPEIGIGDLVSRIEGVLGHEVPKHLIEYPDSYPADEPNRRCPDITKARLQLEFEPRVSLDEGLRRFLSWTDANFTGNT